MIFQSVFFMIQVLEIIPFYLKLKPQMGTWTVTFSKPLYLGMLLVLGEKKKSLTIFSVISIK